MGNKSSKLPALALAASSFIVQVSAQGYSTGFGGSNPEAALVEFFNEMVFYTFEAGSVAEITLYFVAPLFGFYMINKNIFTVGFESFEERIDRDSWSRTDDDIPTGLKGVALAVAFMTVQVAGVFGTVFLLGAGALAATAWILGQIGVLSSSGGGESTTTDTGGSESTSDTDDAAREVSEALGVAEEDEEEAEEDMEQGDLESAEQEIEEAMQLFEGVEGDLSYILSHETSHIMTLKNKVQNLMQDYSKYDVKKGRLSPVSKMVDETEDRCNDLRTGIAQDQANGIGDPTDPNSRLLQKYDSHDPNLEELAEMLKQRLADNVMGGKQKTEEEIHDELDELIHHVNRLLTALQFLKRLNDDLSVLKEDEEKMRQLVERARQEGKAPGKGLREAVKGDDRELEKLMSNLNDLSDPAKLQTVQTQLSSLMSELEKITSVDKSDIQNVKSDVNDLIDRSGTKGKIPKLVEAGEAVYGNDFDNEYKGKSFRQRFNITLNILQEVYANLETMEQNVDSNDKYLSREIEELRNELNQLGL